MKEIRIGSYTVPTDIILAPLAGISDLAYRLIMRTYGAGFCFFEMLDANSVINRHRDSISILKTIPADSPIAAQLLACSADDLCRASEVVLSHVQPAFIDINSACPVRKVIKKKAGAYLLQSPEILCEMIRAMKRNFSLPITVKLRCGLNANDDIDMCSLVRELEDAGAAALFVHGRTRMQMYSGDIDYPLLGAIKDSLTIPMIASGNILSPPDAITMFEKTNCDGVLVARGSFGYPWIFQDIESLRTHGTYREKNLHEKIAILRKHLSLINTYQECSEHGKIGIMRRISQWSIKGVSGARQTRHLLNTAKSFEEIQAIIDTLMK